MRVHARAIVVCLRARASVCVCVRCMYVRCVYVSYVRACVGVHVRADVGVGVYMRVCTSITIVFMRLIMELFIQYINFISKTKRR